jgi:hypothetical protein
MHVPVLQPGEEGKVAILEARPTLHGFLEKWGIGYGRLGWGSLEVGGRSGL